MLSAEQTRVLPNGDQQYTTVSNNRTFLYSGASSDQDVYLLRHLPFDGQDLYGHADWTVWRALASNTHPAYFTSYPNRTLDARDDTYVVGPICDLVGQNHEALIDSYYTHFHPQLPVLESKDLFSNHLASHSVPASLLAAVYSAGLDFWNGLIGDNARQHLRNIVFESTAREARTPSLRTVQTVLIYLQLAPSYVREPNHPGFWPLTAQLVGIAQEIGLHVDPDSWKMSPSERSLRRILWWSVYMQDKWLAHWYGRPSHITEKQYDLEVLQVSDFSGENGILDASLSGEAVAAFVSLSQVTPVLSSSLDRLYTVRNSPCLMSAEDALAHASRCQEQLSVWLGDAPLTLERPGVLINNFQATLAYYGIAISIQRAVFACAGGTTHYDRSKEEHLYSKIFDLLENLLQQDLPGLWLSYCKANLAIIGSFIIVALLSSTDDKVYNARFDILGTYCEYLDRLAPKYSFAALPKLRFHLLLQRLPQQRVPVTTVDPADFNHSPGVWAA